MDLPPIDASKIKIIGTNNLKIVSAAHDLVSVDHSEDGSLSKCGKVAVTHLFRYGW